MQSQSFNRLMTTSLTCVGPQPTHEQQSSDGWRGVLLTLKSACRASLQPALTGMAQLKPSAITLVKGTCPGDSAVSELLIRAAFGATQHPAMQPHAGSFHCAGLGCWTGYEGGAGGSMHDNIAAFQL